MPPTSSWRALETSLPWPGAAQAESQAGGTAAAARSGERSRRNRRHMLFFNTSRFEGHHNSEMRQELEAKRLDSERGSEQELFQRHQVGGCRTHLAGSRTAAASVPNVPTRTDGEASERT